MSPCLLVLLCACGKIGDPLPPIPRAPLTVTELQALQRGDKIILSVPLSRTPRSILPSRIDIYRVIESDNDSPGLTEAAFSARASLIASLNASEILVGSSIINYEDLIDFNAASGKPRYRYAVRMVNREDRPADLSNYALLTPVGEIAQPPTELKTSLTQTELEITWTAPAANVSGQQPASIAGYNLYRRIGDAVTRLNQRPLTEPRFVDRTFQFDTAIEYTVRALSLPAPGRPITDALESNESLPVKITPKDTFAPTAPDSITIASVNSIVSLFWPANPEPDTAGYNVYRSEDANASPDKWVKLNAQLHKPTSFRDERVQVGKQYFYQITAVDGNGNESPRSVTLAETVNP